MRERRREREGERERGGGEGEREIPLLTPNPRPPSLNPQIPFPPTVPHLAEERRRDVHAEDLAVLGGVLGHLEDGLRADRDEEAGAVEEPGPLHHRPVVGPQQVLQLRAQGKGEALLVSICASQWRRCS